jgi:hypothetical protein
LQIWSGFRVLQLAITALDLALRVATRVCDETPT